MISIGLCEWEWPWDWQSLQEASSTWLGCDAGFRVWEAEGVGLRVLLEVVAAAGRTEVERLGLGLVATRTGSTRDSGSTFLSASGLDRLELARLF
jgi:hypothetical protein